MHHAKNSNQMTKTTLTNTTQPPQHPSHITSHKHNQTTYRLQHKHNQTNTTKPQHITTSTPNIGTTSLMQSHMKTEEVTLEPTPPLKRIYTPPSIKVLFPLNQCKSSVHKFTTNSIKTYTSQYKKNMIHNLSDHTLTDKDSQFSPKAYPLLSPSPKLLNKKQINPGISSRLVC